MNLKKKLFKKKCMLKLSSRNYIAYTRTTLNFETILDEIKIYKIKDDIKITTKDDLYKLKKVPNKSIISVVCENKCLGMDFRKKTGKYMKNSISFLIFVNNKFINIQCFREGIMQIPGCKKEGTALRTVLYLFQRLAKNMYSVKFKKLKITIRRVNNNYTYKTNKILLFSRLKEIFNKTDYLNTNPAGKLIVFNKEMDRDKFVNKLYSTYNCKGELIERTNLLSIKGAIKKKKYGSKFKVFKTGTINISCYDYNLMYNDFLNFLKIIKEQY